MAAFTPQGAGLLRGWQRIGRFDTEMGQKLPLAYQKFRNEWRVQKPAPIHFIPENVDQVFKRNDLTGQVNLNQNVPIPLKSIPEEHQGIWGGEAVILGFQKKNAYKRRVPQFWFPSLELSVVRSEVLNENFEVSVTKRTISNILENHGFDHYLLNTAAVDLRSLLACTIKQRVLFDIISQYPAWSDSPKKQKELTKEFNIYQNIYTQLTIDAETENGIN